MFPIGTSESGIVSSNSNQNDRTQIMLDRCGSITNNLSHDIIFSIFQACLNLRDANTIGTLALLNRNYNQSIPHVSAMKPEDIYKVCPRMRVVDAKVLKKFQIEINDEPSLNPSQILQFYREMISHIEGKAGVMLLTLWKGLNPQLLLSIAGSNGIEVIDDTSGDLEKAASISLEETIVVMMPNGIFKNSRNKTYSEQNEDVLRPLGCEMATLTATTALWFFTYTLSRNKIWLFNDVLEGTYIRTPETIEQEEEDNKKHLCFEADYSGKLIFTVEADKDSSDACGAIGMRKLDGCQKVMPIELKPNKRRVSSPIIKHAVHLAIQGNLNEAFEVLNKYDFNKAQIRTIDQLLQLCQQYPNQAPNWQSQLAYLVKEAVDSIRFTENPPSALANAYFCTFEFSGKIYQCAEAAFQAQKYTDQPQIMDLFTSCDAEEAIELAALNPMTDVRRRSWENPFEAHLFKDNVLMHVLRAKFGQNPFLKDVLVDTESSHLVCLGGDPYLNQDTDGEGINILGLSLMRLREEYKED